MKRGRKILSFLLATGFLILNFALVSVLVYAENPVEPDWCNVITLALAIDRDSECIRMYNEDPSNLYCSYAADAVECGGKYTKASQWPCKVRCDPNTLYSSYNLYSYAEPAWCNNFTLRYRECIKQARTNPARFVCSDHADALQCGGVLVAAKEWPCKVKCMQDRPNLYYSNIPCNDECKQGEKRCNGNIKQECGNYDADSCYEWPPNTTGNGNTDCGSKKCLDGECVIVPEKEIQCNGIDDNLNGKTDGQEFGLIKEACQLNNERGVCVNKLCVKANSAILTLDENYLNNLPVDKKEYLGPTQIPKRAVGSSYLVVSPYDELSCQSNFISYSSEQPASNTELTVKFKVGSQSKDKKCKLVNVLKITDPTLISLGFNYKADVVCGSEFDRIEGEGRGKEIYCESSVTSKTVSSAAKSNNLVIAKYLYYFVRVNQDDFGDVKKMYNEFVNLGYTDDKTKLFVSLNEINENTASAAKAIYLANVKGMKFFDELGKKEFIIEKTKFFGYNYYSCNINTKNLAEKLKTELSKIYKRVPYNDDDRFIFVSQDILDEYVQCKSGMIDSLTEKIASPVKGGVFLVSVPFVAITAGLFSKANVADASRKIGEGVAYAVTLPVKLPIRTIFAITDKIDFGLFEDSFLEAIFEVGNRDIAIATKQRLLGMETQPLIAMRGDKSIVVRGSDKYSLTKGLVRSYDSSVCYEDSVDLYTTEKKENACSNEWPKCCKDGLTSQYIGSLQRLPREVIETSLIAYVGTILEVLPDPEKIRILGSCGAHYDCPGWPLKFDPNTETGAKETNPPKSAVGSLIDQTRFPVTDTGPFIKPREYRG